MTLESDGITISLGAPGFTQYLRRPPVHCPGHALPVEERGGFSFDRRGYTPDGRSRPPSTGTPAKTVSLSRWPMMAASPTMLGRTRHSW